jgi:hypothetical protein
LPIVITWSANFLADIETLSTGVFQHALDNNIAPAFAEQKFKDDLKLELKRVLILIQNDPFIYQSYHLSINPTRRAVIFNKELILEYQLVPTSAIESSQVNEVILTALVVSRSGRYNSAYDNIDAYDIDDIFN